MALVLGFLAPDLSFLGYLANPRVGAHACNVAHFEALPVALAVAGLLSDSAVAVQIALIWLAHIGLDRALGYGFKHPTAFADTHFERL